MTAHGPETDSRETQRQRRPLSRMAEALINQPSYTHLAPAATRSKTGLISKTVAALMPCTHTHTLGEKERERTLSAFTVVEDDFEETKTKCI